MDRYKIIAKVNYFRTWGGILSYNFREEILGKRCLRKWTSGIDVLV